MADHGCHGSGQEHLSPSDLGFVVAAVARRANEMAMHVYGCRIIQRRNGRGMNRGKRVCVFFHILTLYDMRDMKSYHGTLDGLQLCVPR